MLEKGQCLILLCKMRALQLVFINFARQGEAPADATFCD